MTTPRTTKTMLRYPGGKSRAVKTLSPMIPEDTATVISPFLGGGSFELHLTSKGIQVDTSDLFSQLVTFWTVMSDNPDGLADRLETLLGNLDKETFSTFQKRLRSEDGTEEEIATMFYAVNRCSFSGTTLSGGYSKAAATGRFTPSSVNRVRDFHNDLLRVSHADYRDVIDKDTDLLFLDPPYLLGGSRDSLYGNKGDMHEAFDHVEFRDRVKDTGTKALVTYNNTEEIHDLWEDSQWSVHEVSWSYGMNDSKKSSEVVIVNYSL